MKKKVKYYKKIEIPIKIIERIKKDSNLREHIKKTVLLSLIGILILSQIPILSAFEAHIINVTAKICNYSQTRTMGFWKNHEEVYDPWLLPLYLGDEYINSKVDVDLVFDNANARDMIDMLKGQLLAMKFNIAYFGIGGYYVEADNMTIDEIVALADNMLSLPGNYTRQEMEHIKTLLDSLNSLHYISYCSGVSPVIPEDIVSFNSVESESLLLEPMNEIIEIIETATPSDSEGPGQSEQEHGNPDKPEKPEKPEKPKESEELEEPVPEPEPEPEPLPESLPEEIIE